MNEKKRLLTVLKGERVDRPPVICPGGMMNAAVTEVIKDVDENHNVDVEAMVKSAIKVHELTGFENFGVPFCMTVECEPLGVELDLGDKHVEPLVTRYSQKSTEEIMETFVVDPRQTKRMPVVLEAINRLRNNEIPVIGNITGPISTASSVIDPLVFFKAILKEPERSYKFLNYINNLAIEYAKAMIESGADVIAISDPTATGEILGKKNFEKIAIPLYKKLVEEIHKHNIRVLIHICGNARNVLDSLNVIEADALSFDSIVNMKYAKAMIETRLMGNISTSLLHTGQEEKILSITRNCINSGVDIISPACGLGMGTPLKNLKTLTSFVKRGIQ